MNQRPVPERDEQILDLLDGNLSEEQQAELRDWLSESPEHWERFAHLSFLHSQIASQIHSQRSSDGIRLEALQGVPTQDALPPIHIDADVMTKKKVVSALTYVVEHTLTPKRLAIAATLLMGVVLGIVLMGGPDTQQQVVERPDQPDGPVTPMVVATLTAEHDAVWDRRPGQDLYAGQRLTLAAGFAEITTQRGAVVILEAPATVELLDNNNALRLHAGKLVGICETPSSKGLLVRTPHMDVIDLGTRFGLSVAGSRMTATVFTGEIELVAPGIQPRKLTLNQTARMNVVDGGYEVVVEQGVANDFVEQWPRQPLVLAAGINDPRFQVEVVAQGLRHSAKVHVDRTHQISGLNGQSIPTVLLGGDLIRTPGDARPGYANNTDGIQIEIELASHADIYILFSQGGKVPAWLTRDYTLTELRAGLDYVDAADQAETVRVGRTLSVWKRNQTAGPGRHIVGRAMTAESAYFLVAVPTDQGRAKDRTN